MPMIDGDRDEVVIRIVYDGPPLAGKTTSLRALTGMLPAGRRSELYTPAEAEGRTLYFDWVDYLGGWFDGLQVRCQIVSVPGQRALVERRVALLRDADAVVFVAESTAAGAELALDCYEELRRTLDSSASDGPVPVVLQANKQDLPGTISPEELRDLLPDDRYLAILGSSAADGRGVKEAFTFAVRLALDRVRTLAKDGRLAVGEPPVRRGEDLLEALLHWEGEQPDSSSTRLPRADRAALGGRTPGETRMEDVGSECPPGTRQPSRSADPSPTDPPAVPDSSVPSGLVWPPIAGRIVLRELESCAAHLRQDADGAWTAVADGRWRLVSEASLLFADMEVGRARLLESARVHTALEPILSEHRALVLSEAGGGFWRLWKIVRIEKSLVDLVSDLAGNDAGSIDIASQLFAAADALMNAEERLREADAPLVATLSQIGISNDRPRYLGIVPDGGDPRAAMRRETGLTELVRSELASLVGRIVETPSFDARTALNRLGRISRERPDRVDLVEALSLLLIGS